MRRADTPLVVADATDPAVAPGMAERTRVVVTTAGSLPALRFGAPRGVRATGHRLSRSLRRTRVDAPDDRRARRAGQGVGRAHPVLLRLRLPAVGARRVVLPAGGEGTTRRRRPAGEGPSARLRRRGLGRLGGHHGTPPSRPRQADPAVARLLAGSRSASSPDSAGPTQPTDDRQLDDPDVGPVVPFMLGADRLHERASLELPDGASVRRRLRLRRDAGRRPRRDADGRQATGRLPKPGEGPTRETREAGSFDVLFIGLACDGRQVRVSVKGDRDPGYGSTSKMIAETALCLLDADDVAGGHVDTGGRAPAAPDGPTSGPRRTHVHRRDDGRVICHAPALSGR